MKIIQGQLFRMHEAPQNQVRRVSMMEWDGLTPPDPTQLVSEISIIRLVGGGEPPDSFDHDSKPRVIVTRAIPHSPSRYPLGCIIPPADQPQTVKIRIRSDWLGGARSVIWLQSDFHPLELMKSGCNELKREVIW